MNTYVVLMREMKEKARLFQLDPVPLMRLAEENGIQVSELFTSIGIFQATLVCRAPSNEAIARMLDGLEGWHTDTLLATTHVTFERAE